MKFRLTAIVSSSKDLGVVEAKSKKEALRSNEASDADVYLCHSCTNECEDPIITEIIAEEVKD
jgi:hypothetical protein